MSLLGRAFGGRSEGKVLDASALTWQSLFGFPVKSGVSVNTDTALRQSTVFACTRVLSEGIAQLPLKLYQEREDGVKQLAKKHPLYTRLWRKPNDFQTSFEWRETMMFHAVLTQGGHSIISRNSRGEVLEFLPVLPQRVRVIQDAKWNVAYEISDANGAIAMLPKSSVLHLKGPSWNGYSGLDAVVQAREAIGLGIATEESLARLYSNGARPSGLLSTDATLKQEQYDRIKKAFQEGYAGLQNAFKTIFLDAGMKYSQMSLSPVDSQTHESRKHQIEEICRFLRVFPQMIGYGDKTSTYASAEQFFMAHVTHSLMPWIERFEQVLAVQLLTEDELDQGFFPKFSVAALLRGDAKSRAEYYASGIVNGWMTRNEARKLEDLDPLDGLDKPLVPLNMGVKGDPTTDPAAAAVDQKMLARAIAEELGLPQLEAKIGRVLSLKNENKLKQARDLIGEVIDQVDQQAAA
jgi:HK97 family phage portal protein